MAFTSVLGDGVVAASSKKPVSVQKQAAARVKRITGVGCDHCPLNDVAGINKVKNLKRVKGREIFIWGIAPGPVDNAEQLVFAGPAGQFLWRELERLKVSRKDADVQYVVRCWPTAEDELTGRITDRAPTKQEIKCCSVYNDEAIALNAGKAAVHLVFGQVAAQSLLGREYKKTAPSFWSEKLKAKVFVFEHPTSIRNASAQRMNDWRNRLKQAVQSVKSRGQFAYLESQDYKLIRNGKQALRAAKEIRAYAYRRSSRVSADIEYGWVDEETGQACDPGTGKQVVLVLGLSHKPGVSRVFVIDHPENTHSKKSRRQTIEALASVLSDKDIQMVFHHGTADTIPIESLLGIKVRGYDFDTNYSTYLTWPQMKKYGLGELSNTKVQEFAGYKNIVVPYINSEKVNYATIPLKVMRLYNGADCDITKRLEILTKTKEGPLLRTYKDVAYVLADMQKRGPYFDKKYYDDVVYLVPKRLETVKKRLVKLSGNPDINLNAPMQVSKVLYDDLGFEPIPGEGMRSTAAPVLRAFALDKSNGEFPKLLSEYRELVKMEGTYLSNYRESARLHGGQLRTLWWLTGTITGRLRSGGKEKGQTGIVNFQNLHGEPLLQNLLISDPKWRRVNSLLDSADMSEKAFGKAYHTVKRKISPLQLFLALDYGQVEIRMAAEMSRDPKLIEAVESGDIHSAVGHELTGWPIEKIKHDKPTRTLIKNLHFGILFGMSQNSLYTFLTGLGVDISRSRSDELHVKYFRKYSKVKELIEYLKEFAEKHNYVETMFGFRRPINTGGDDDDGRGTFWGNQSINSPIQGSAHQLMLFAMATLKQKPKTFAKLQTPVMEVHDAFDFYTTVEDLPDAYAEARKLLEVAVPEYIQKNYGRTLRVPLVAEGTAGFRLGVLQEYEGEDQSIFIQKWLQKNKKIESEIMAKWKVAA